MHFFAVYCKYFKKLLYLCSRFHFLTLIRMKEIQRTSYLEWLSSWREKGIIKVITGIRRCGKSTLMRQFQRTLLNQGVLPDQIISLNFEDMTYSHLMTAKTLHDHIVSLLQNEKMNYIFLDEVQLVSEFEKAVNSLYLRSNVDIYITGSNAHMLSGELATLLSGRYVKINMLPLSFREYTQDLPYVYTKEYNDYISSTSFPFKYQLSSLDEVRQYVRDIYDTVMMRDVVTRYNIHDVNVLNNVALFLADNIGNLTNPKRIADILASNGLKISPHTIDTYLEALTNCYLFYPAQRLSIKGAEILRSARKYYLADIGLRNALLSSQNADQGRILENIVFLELLRRYYFKPIYVGQVGGAEIDFVCHNGENYEYYQVALSVMNPDTLKRELAPLKALKDHYPRFLITLDPQPVIDHDGIKQIYAVDWLLGR